MMCALLFEQLILYCFDIKKSVCAGLHPMFYSFKEVYNMYCTFDDFGTLKRGPLVEIVSRAGQGQVYHI